MKVYGANKATEFSSKQVNVIYAKAKAGELLIEKWVVTEFYSLAGYYGFDDNGAVARSEAKIKAIIDAVFAKDIAKAQELIDAYTESEFALMSRKAQAKAQRSLVA